MAGIGGLLHKVVCVRSNELDDNINCGIELFVPLTDLLLVVFNSSVITFDVEARIVFASGSGRVLLDVFDVFVNPLVEDPIGNGGDLSVGDLDARFGSPNIGSLDRSALSSPIGNAELVCFLGLFESVGSNGNVDSVAHCCWFLFTIQIYKNFLIQLLK